jgi:hypothetical protein
MIRQCVECKTIIGEKEPLEDKSVTHTYCDSCFEKQMGFINRYKQVDA